MFEVSEILIVEGAALAVCSGKTRLPGVSSSVSLCDTFPPSAPLSMQVSFSLAGNGRTILAQTLVHQCDDLVQRVGVKSLLAGNPSNQAVDALDVLGPAEKRARGRRGVTETLG